KPFEAKYGVKVSIWRAGTDKVLQRTLAEAAARKYDVDLIHFGSPEMEALSREKILQAVNSPVHKDLQPGSVPAHREWAATLLSVWVQVYNTNLIRKSDLPRTVKILQTDLIRSLDETDKWTKLFEDVVLKRPGN